MLIRNVEMEGCGGLDCRIDGGFISEIGPGLVPKDHENTRDGCGGALLPGLTDHHLHLFAMAAQSESVDLSEARSIEAALLERRHNPHDGKWIRAVGWDDQRHGALERGRLDAIVPDAPLRVQHRSGALWVLNSCGLEVLSVDESNPPLGAERDATGRLTGRLWRSDSWLRSRLDDHPPNLAPVGIHLAALGVTAVSDATPDLDDAAVQLLARSVVSGAVPQRVQVLGTDALPIAHERLSLGPHKLVIADHDLPSPDDLALRIFDVHQSGRSVAVHCVSREALALTVAALQTIGTRPGDRVEHCAIADEAAVRELARLGLVVVTQPTLVTRRGDDYLARHEASEHRDLWRYRSLLDAGIAVVASSDAPYGDSDPWATIRSARDRVTRAGRVLGEDERVPSGTTLAGFLVPFDIPAAQPRRLARGAVADLVLLDVPLISALAEPEARQVSATWIGGEVIYSR